MKIAQLTALASLALLLGPVLASRAAEPDFAAAHQETMDTLRAFVRVDTSSPPGNETRGAEFLKAILDKAGIPCELVGANPARLNLVARLKGSGKKRPIVLMGHTDVVGVERDKWTVDPFEGVIKDGFLYGRGSSDDKCMTTVCLEVMLLLKRANVQLDRDVIFVAEADEESTALGVIELVNHHWDKIDCEFALNEGGVIAEEGGKIKYVGVATSEKVPRTLFLSATGSSGHGSAPRADNPVVHLATAIAKIGAWQPPVRLNETTRTFFQRLALVSSPEEAWLFTHFNDPVVGAQVQEILRRTEKYYFYNSNLRTSISPTVFKAGFRFNVIPGDALATLDVRALPDEDMGAFIKTLAQLIDDPAITITPNEAKQRPATPPSGLDNAMFAALEHAQQAVYPGSVTIPTMLNGATDSAYLREKGVQAYGIGSLTSLTDGGNRAHGNDERVNLAGIKGFLEFVYRATVEVAGAK
jgi:acetylornithine deacetylase/succinyl-diaminopimelate desuccinylase-like protein